MKKQMKQVRKDRLTQIVLIGSIGIAFLTVCLVAGYTGFILGQGQARPLLISAPEVSILLLAHEGESIRLWYNVVGQVPATEELDIQMGPGGEKGRAEWSKDLSANEGDLVQMRVINRNSNGLVCQFLIDGTTWLTDLATGTDECVLSGIVR